METSEFVKQFNFSEKGRGLVGVERECFLTDLNGVIQPMSSSILKYLKGDGRFGYELSACQLEDRVGPCSLNRLKEELEANDRIMTEAGKALGFKRSYMEVAPVDMPLDVYPDPTGRYKRITASMPQDILRAACRVAGTHIHVGMSDPEGAMEAYHQAIQLLPKLIQWGDHSNGERLRIYKMMAPDMIPPAYPGGWEEFHEHARSKGFESNPRNCWHLIRISVHGTIEFRMFGSTSDNARIKQWAWKCWAMCGFYDPLRFW